MEPTYGAGAVLRNKLKEKSRRWGMGVFVGIVSLILLLTSVKKGSTFYPFLYHVSIVCCLSAILGGAEAGLAETQRQ